MIWSNGIITDGNLQAYPQMSGGQCIYEVVRVIDGYPVFLMEHLERLKQSAIRSGIHAKTDLIHLSSGMKSLIEAENCRNGNVRIQINRSGKESVMGFIPHHYPSPENYHEGVTVELLIAERSQPNLKIWNPEVRTAADKIIKETGAWEVILVNQKGLLTEGSRSNLFMVVDNLIITPPLQQILPGITRQKVMLQAKANSIEVKEENLPLSDLKRASSVFLTGTSPGVLPVKQIQTYIFDPRHPLIHRVSTLYQQSVNDDIKKLQFRS